MIPALLFLLWFPSFADAATLFTIPDQTYAAGTYTLNATNIPTGFTQFRLTFSRQFFTDPAVQLVVNVDLSDDAGKTWLTPWCGFTTRGGNPGKTTPANSILVCFCTVGSSCSAANGQNRLRGSITITGGSLRTSGTIETQ